MKRYNRCAYTLFSYFLIALCAACGSSSSSSPSRPPARLLASESFDACTFSPGWSASFVREDNYPPGVAPFVELPDHGCVMQQYVPAGADEITSAQVGVEGDDEFLRITGSPQVDEFYVEWQEFFPEGHDFPDGSQKMLRFTYYNAGDNNGSQINLSTQNENTNIQLFLYHPEGENGEFINLFYDTNLPIPVGRWVNFAVWARLNTLGQADGFAVAYMDGNEIARLDNISNRGSDSRGWNVMWVGGNYTNQGPTANASNRFIDNIRWYNTKP